jgi:hypothetical protein
MCLLFEVFVLAAVTIALFGDVNPLNAELNPIRHLLAMLGTHHILHVSRIRVKQLWETYCFHHRSDKIR